MDLIKLFWYLIHVERMVRNSNSISADLIEDTLENDWNEAFLALFRKICGSFAFFAIEDKQYTYIIGTNKHLFALGAKQTRKAHQMPTLLPVSKACTYKFYIFRQYTYSSFSLIFI